MLRLVWPVADRTKKPRRLRSACKARRRCRPLLCEQLEARTLLSAIPFGAAPADTGEFMLGSVTVTVVLMESTGQVDPSTEDWTPQLIQQVKQKVQEGVNWWRDTLANYSSVHGLNFVFDFTYADNPVPTRYEPINRTSDAYTLWVNEFLDFVGFNTPKSIDEDIRQFNHAQRLAHGTNWAFTIFVVNATNDLDGQFAPGGSFSQAFSFAGGRFMVAPSTRPASTFAHETGHMFWARDEYLGGGSWTDRRGYYDTQNWNAADNPTPGFVQQDSIMAAGTKLLNAYQLHVSPPSTLAQVGWQDSDNDGVFDVLDVPHQLSGIGYRDPATGRYRFVGTARVGTLPNRNSSGLQNDITINTISRSEYRIDGGPWTTAATYGTYEADLDLSLPVPAGPHTVEIRTLSLDPITGQLVTMSPVFVGSTMTPSQIGNYSLAGFVWNDVDGDGVWDAKEIGLPGQLVRLIDNQGNPLTIQKKLDPDEFDDAAVLNTSRAGLTLSAVGWAVANDQVLSREATIASTGNRVFAFRTSTVSVGLDWRRDAQELHIRFDTPQSVVSLDAIGLNADSYGRLEAYDGAGALVARYNTGRLSSGQVETMTIARPQADIVLIKAFGQSGTSVALDNLRYGAIASTTSGTFGSFALGPLSPGTYFVDFAPNFSGQRTSPSSGFFTVNVTTGGTTEGLHFGIRPDRPWRNPIRPVDVSGDGRLTTFDVLALLTELSRNGARTLPAPTDQFGPAPFFDVTGDNILSTLDVFPVLSALRSGSGSGEASSWGAPAPPSGGYSSRQLPAYPVVVQQDTPAASAESLPGLPGPASLASNNARREATTLPPALVDSVLAHWHHRPSSSDRWTSLETKKRVKALPGRIGMGERLSSIRPGEGPNGPAVSGWERIGHERRNSLEANTSEYEAEDADPENIISGLFAGREALSRLLSTGKKRG
ncbi:MAG: hypothetical protein KatS3mg110_0588 [Pirellulaceae bacterium]|nr:MAG: hypothetical protein KatS3mg110_0588 [Pirellulaceae bacterium]